MAKFKKTLDILVAIGAAVLLIGGEWPLALILIASLLRTLWLKPSEGQMSQFAQVTGVSLWLILLALGVWFELHGRS